MNQISKSDISVLAKVSPKAKLGLRAKIGDFSIVHDNVVLGDDVTIESHCIIGYPTPLAQGQPLLIGDRSFIRSHSVFYEGSSFGPGLITGHRVTVRENLKAGAALQIGTLSDLQGNCEIGDYVRTHSNVHIGQKTTIGNYVWIFPYAVFTNDPHPPSDTMLGVTVEDYVVVATMSCILPGVRLGARSFVGAHSLVSRDVEPDSLVTGVPAKKIGSTSLIKLKDDPTRSAYPWMGRFHRGYPSPIVEQWKKEFD